MDSWRTLILIGGWVELCCVGSGLLLVMTRFWDVYVSSCHRVQGSIASKSLIVMVVGSVLFFLFMILLNDPFNNGRFVGCKAGLELGGITWPGTLFGRVGRTPDLVREQVEDISTRIES